MYFLFPGAHKGHYVCGAPPIGFRAKTFRNFCSTSAWERASESLSKKNNRRLVLHVTFCSAQAECSNRSSYAIFIPRESHYVYVFRLRSLFPRSRDYNVLCFYFRIHSGVYDRIVQGLKNEIGDNCR